MLDINKVREQPEQVRQALQARQMNPALIEPVLELDKERRALLAQVEVMKAERNTVTKR